MNYREIKTDMVCPRVQCQGAYTRLEKERDELHRVAGKRGDVLVEQQIEIEKLERERDQFRSDASLREAERDRAQDWQMVAETELDEARMELRLLNDERDALRDLILRIQQWDHMFGAADGTYWQNQINKALRGTQND